MVCLVPKCNEIWRDIRYIQLPIGSMYAIYGNIYHQYTPNVSIYTIHGSYGLWLSPKKVRWPQKKEKMILKKHMFPINKSAAMIPAAFRSSMQSAPYSKKWSITIVIGLENENCSVPLCPIPGVSRTQFLMIHNCSAFSQAYPKVIQHLHVLVDALGSK